MLFHISLLWKYHIQVGYFSDFEYLWSLDQQSLLQDNLSKTGDLLGLYSSYFCIEVLEKTMFDYIKVYILYIF